MIIQKQHNNSLFELFNYFLIFNFSIGFSFICLLSSHLSHYLTKLTFCNSYFNIFMLKLINIIARNLKYLWQISQLNPVYQFILKIVIVVTN